MTATPPTTATTGFSHDCHVRARTHVFVAGSTGVLGRRLVDRLADRGHDVAGLVRDDAGAERVHERGGTPRPRRVPSWLVRPLLGGDAVRLLTRSMPTRNDRFREAFDWEPSLPTHERGLERVRDRWLEEGTLREVDDGYEWAAE